MSKAGGISVRLWDIPVRLVHWSFVILLPAMWYTGYKADIDLHARIGMLLLALLVFRLLWGVVGSATARFGQFVKGPGAILAYLRGIGDEPGMGHNPLGALSVVALLALLAAQIGFGLFAQDVDGLNSGPLSALVSYDTADWARGRHHLVFNLILAMVALHIAAILFYALVKRDDLVRPMVTGSKIVKRPVPAPGQAPLWRALPCAAVAVLLAWWVWRGAPLPWL